MYMCAPTYVSVHNYYLNQVFSITAKTTDWIISFSILCSDTSMSIKEWSFTAELAKLYECTRKGTFFLFLNKKCS